MSGFFRGIKEALTLLVCYTALIVSYRLYGINNRSHLQRPSRRILLVLHDSWS